MILLLLGCGLTGDWSGTIECDDGSEADVEATLEPDGANEWSGEMEMSTTVTVEGYEIFGRYTYDIVLEMDGAMGEQEVEMSGELSDCYVEMDGEDVTDQVECDEGTEIDNDGEDWTWDGANTIEVDGDDCDGEVERD